MILSYLVLADGRRKKVSQENRTSVAYSFEIIHSYYKKKAESYNKVIKTLIEKMITDRLWPFPHRLYGIIYIIVACALAAQGLRRKSHRHN